MEAGDRDQSIFSAVLWRLFPVLLAVILAMVGRYWLSLSNLLFFVGGINPSGTEFICYIYNDAGDDVFPQIRDLETGELLHDFSDLEAAWGESVAWIDDETIAVLIDDRSSIETESRCHVEIVQLSPERRIIARNEIADQYVSTIVPDGNGHYCFLIGKNKGADRYFKIMRSPPVGGTTGGKGVELVKIDLGDQEEAYMSRFSRTPPGNVLVYVLPSSRGNAKTPKESGPEDFKHTDGVNQTTMMIDATTGEIIQAFSDSKFVKNSDRFVWKETPSGFEIYRLGEMETPVETLALKNVVGSLDPMAINEQQLFAVETIGSKPRLRILDRKSRVEKEFEFPDRTSTSLHETVGGTWLHGSAPMHIYSFPSDGTIWEFDPDTGKSHFIATARPYYSLARAVAWGGIPLLLLIASAITVLSGKRMPFLDMGVACVLIACVFSAWSSDVGANKGPLLPLTEASLGAAVALLLVWVSTSRALYGFAIPLAIVTIAVILMFYMFSWRGDNSAFEGLGAAFLIIFFQALAHVLFRRFIGTIHGPNASPDTSRQFSVREIAITIAAVAFSFACFRHVKFGESQVPNTVVAWMFVFAFTYAVCVVVATWCAFKVQNAFTSGIAALLGSTLIMAMLYGTTTLTGLNIQGTAYIQPLVAAVVVWWTLRLCRRAGYQFVPCLGRTRRYGYGGV